MKQPLRFSVFICLTLALALQGCGGNPSWLPRAHKITIQQGNLINEAELAQVEIGMSREIVRNLIGTPVLNTPFHADRWEYVYTKGPAGESIQARRAVIRFDDEVVVEVSDNRDIESGERPDQRYFWEKQSSQ